MENSLFCFIVYIILYNIIIKLTQEPYKEKIN